MAARQRAGLALIAAACVVFLPAAQSTPVEWMWAGALTTDTAVVKVKVRQPSEGVFLTYRADGEIEPSGRVPADALALPDQDGIVEFALHGLSPNTRYFYTVEGNGTGSQTGELRTVARGPISFDVAAASCAGGGLFSSVSNHEIFTTIENRRPLFFLHMGDFHYKNISRNDPAQFRRAYDQVLTQSRQASFYRHVPVVYVWDDHDYGPNDSDRTSPARDAALVAYAQVVPHYPLVTQDGRLSTIQQAFTVGRVRFIVNDMRAARDPVGQPDGPGKTMLGAAQRGWLDEEFSRAAREEVPLIIWVSTVPWITRTGDKKHGWEPYSWERQWLADRIEALGLTRRIVMVSGDAHMVAIDDGTHSNYASAGAGTSGFPVLHAAPLDRSPSVKGGPYSHGVSNRNHQFGWIEVRDDGNSVLVSLSGHDSAGRQLPGMLLRLACRAGTCAADR